MKKKNEVVPKSSTEILFAEAKIKEQEKRHDALNNLFDQATEVLSDAISDTRTTAAEKIFPAKLAIDTYLAKEKLLREDARYELEKSKLEVDKERLKLERDKLSAPGGPLYVIQKVENQTVKVEAGKSSEALKNRKIAQAKALEEISGVPQFVDIPDDKL